MLHELDSVVLLQDLPDHGLRASDVGTIVLLHNILGTKSNSDFLKAKRRLRYDTAAIMTAYQPAETKNQLSSTPPGKRSEVVPRT
jgi:hypothetical protein